MMRRFLCVLLVLMLAVALAVTAAAEEPTLSTNANTMTCYEGGYGAVPARYRCSVDIADSGYSEWFDISYGDPLVAQWPTEVGTHSVTFTVNQKVGDGEYPFTVTLEIVILELPETSGTCGDNMTWRFDTETDTLTISGTGAMYPIAESNEAFWNGEYTYEPGWWYLPVRHVVVEEGVEQLPNYCFFQNWNNYYTIHETISLPSTLQAIPEEGFLAATAMTSLTIPEGITSLTGWPFGSPGSSFTSLTELHLPSTIAQLDPVTVVLAGLNNKTAQPTLTTIRYAGTEEQWNQIELVTSDFFQAFFGDDYENFRENWIVPATEQFSKLNVIFEAEETGLFDITIDSPITMSQLYATQLNHDSQEQLVYLDWSYNGLLDATVAGTPYTGITTYELAEVIREAYSADIASVEWMEVNDQIQTPWTVGEANDCQLVLRVLNQEDVVIPCQVIITETDVASVSASPVTYCGYKGWVSPEFTVTYKDGTTAPLPEGIQISYPDGMPSEEGTYAVKILVGYILETEAEVTVLPTPVTGQLGENITWTYDKDKETLTLSGTGATFEALDDEWTELFMYHGPKYIVVEEGIETLTTGIFHYGIGVEALTLPTTLKAIPDALIGWNGLQGDMIDGYVVRTMSSIVIPEGITSLTSSAFYLCMGISDYYLPSTLEEIDLDTLCFVAVVRTESNLEPLRTTIHFAGTQEQWKNIKHVTGSRVYPTGLSDEELEELFSTFTVVFEPKEEITVENGTANVPDSSVEITEGEDVVIDVTGTEETVSSVVIGSETVDKITNAGTCVEIKLPDAAVSFDKTAIGSIGEQLGSNAVTIVATRVEDTTLTAEQKAALEEKTVHIILNVGAFSGEAKLTEFGGGKVTISIPFALPEGKAGTDYYVAYIADDGTVTEMPTVYADGILRFETTHFSNYAVLEKTVVEPPVTEPPVTEPPVTEPPTTVPSTTVPSTTVPSTTVPPVGDNPDTGDVRLVLLSVLLLAGTACLMTFAVRRRSF